MSSVLCVMYFVVLAVLSTYGLHRLHLVMLVRRHRDRIAAVAPPRDADGQPLTPLLDSELPMVTIQLPIFNESTVIERLPAFWATNEAPMPAAARAGSAPSRRARSPRPGRSTLMMSAPRSPRN